ncbi:uncharacterized protein [Ptychodera flava]|uniref:uncharacterized protein n=1 Tax=Ptychodera flava TaxID=63121 RepID=UPI003969C5EC
MIEYSFESDDDDIPLSVIQSKLSPDKHNLHSESCADVDIAVNNGEDDSGVGGGDDDEVDNENDDIPLSVLKQKLSVKDILETAATSGILLDIDNDVVTGDDPFLCNATIPINQNTDGVYECDNSISCPNNIPCNSINNTTIDVHENQSSYSVTFEVRQNDVSVTHPQIFPDITESSRPSVSVTDTTLPTSSDNTFTDLHVYQPNYSVIGADISESSFSPGGHLLFSNNDAVSSWPNQNPQIGSVCELYDSYSAIEAAQCSRDIVSDEVSHANPTDVIGDPCSTSINSPEVSHSEADNLVDDSSRSRLRFRNVTNWKRNIQKRLRNSGQEYTAHTGKRVCARQMIYHQCRCNMDCSKHFSLEERQDIFSKYWNLGSYERQRDFIKAHVTKIGKKRAHSHRKFTKREYNYIQLAKTLR